MSSNSQDQEIDLGQVFNKIGGFFQKGIDSIFDLFLFLKKNFLILTILLISGIVLGYFLDKNNKSYDHQVIVIPNFGSTDYLYSKIDLLESKKKENDTVYLNNLGIKNVSKFNSIKIEPIIDAYKFIQSNEKNFELIRLMAEDGDLEKILGDDLTSKNYPYHIINFSTTNQTTEEETTQPILAFLNNSNYYKSIQKEYVNNIKLKMNANDSTISQINGLLNDFSNTTSNNQKSDKLVYYNENNQLNEIIKTKDLLVEEQGGHKINLINYDATIKVVSSTINIKNTKGLNGKMKLVLPFLLISLFFIFSGLLIFYKRQIKRRNAA
ncbi:MAG: hypothetical protein ABNG98_08385 [Flavobacterium sp.]|jgi:hypothetical protein